MTSTNGSTTASEVVFEQWNMQLVETGDGFAARFAGIDVEFPIEGLSAELLEEHDERDSIDFGDDASEALVKIRREIERAFTGREFAGFADAPGDNSFVNSRERTRSEISAARRSDAFRALTNAGLSDEEIEGLVTAA